MPSHGLAVPRTIPPQTVTGKLNTSTRAITNIVFFKPFTTPLTWLNKFPQTLLAATIMEPPMQTDITLTAKGTRADL